MIQSDDAESKLGFMMQFLRFYSAVAPTELGILV